MLRMEIIAVYFEIHTEYIYTGCGQNVEVFMQVRNVAKIDCWFNVCPPVRPHGTTRLGTGRTFTLLDIGDSV